MDVPIMYQIVLTGPESTGKTTLAKILAKRYQTFWVSEYARTYIEGLERPYEEGDLLPIARGQQQRVEQVRLKAEKCIFVDTHLLVMKIWSVFKYGKCHPWIAQQLEDSKTDLYILCGIDVPWEYDAQREHPFQRAILYEQYKTALQKNNLPYIEVSGSLEERLLFIEQALLSKFGIPKPVNKHIE